MANATDAQACWELFLNFANKMVQNALSFYDGKRSLGWQRDRGPDGGLKVWIIAFW